MHSKMFVLCSTRVVTKIECHVMQERSGMETLFIENA